MVPGQYVLKLFLSFLEKCLFKHSSKGFLFKFYRQNPEVNQGFPPEVKLEVCQELGLPLGDLPEVCQELGLPLEACRRYAKS
jgi:hypothetical protein